MPVSAKSVDAKCLPAGIRHKRNQKTVHTDEEKQCHIDGEDKEMGKIVESEKEEKCQARL